MMASLHTELLLILLMLPSITCQTCHFVPETDAPIVEISTSPLIFARPFNLTCTARLNDNSKLASYSYSRPNNIQWFGPPGLLHECKAESPPDTVMTCILVLDALNEGTAGNYTCKASNFRCTRKKIEIDFHIDTQTPKIVEVPVNQSAIIGSNVTLSCTASGHPKPKIIWTKDNNSDFLQTNPRANIVTDIQKGYSQLVITGVENEDYGEYRCVARNRYGVMTSGAACLYAGSVDIQRPTFVEVPLNRSAGVGSNLTFSCTAIGHPKPTITWIKGNDSHFLQSNPRAKAVTDHEKGHSQLMITGVESGDYGSYWCVARNSAGVKTSRPAYLYPGIVEPSQSKSVKSPTALKSSSLKIIAIAVPCVVITLSICGICGLLWYCRSRRFRDTRGTENPMTAIPCIDSVERTSVETELTSFEPTTMLLQENTYDIIGIPAPFTPAQELLPGEFRVDAPRTLKRELPPTPIEDVPPKRPPKPRKKESTEQQVVCSCMLHSGSKAPRQERSDTLKSKDSGYNSAESRDSIFVEQDNALDGVRKSAWSSENCLEIEGSWEIDVKRLKVLYDQVLGEGEFGVVYKGRYRRQDETILDVAVKQLKDTTSLTDKADLLSEIKILKQAGRHENIVNLVGACSQTEKILVVTELIPGGSLESLLKSKRIEYSSSDWSRYKNVHFGLNDRKQLTIALQIASGMRHLEERKCIHRDLAARNIFIDENIVAKVGDFGMARDISHDGIYTKTSSGKVPWRWLSLESLKDQVYTSRSDVWSFGIVLWEIATYGEEPYPTITTPSDLITWLSNGSRMSHPKHCSEELYEMMCSCWMENPLMRPTFADITKKLKDYLKEYKRPYINDNMINDDGIGSNSEISKPH